MPKARKPRPTKLAEGIKAAEDLLQTLPSISKDIDKLAEEFYNKYMFYEYRDLIELKKEILGIKPAIEKALELLSKVVPFYEELPLLFEYRPIKNLDDLYNIAEKIEFAIDYLATQCDIRARRLLIKLTTTRIKKEKIIELTEEIETLTKVKDILEKEWYRFNDLKYKIYYMKKSLAR